MYENNEEMKNKAKRESREPFEEPQPPAEDKVRLDHLTIFEELQLFKSLQIIAPNVTRCLIYDM